MMMMITVITTVTSITVPSRFQAGSKQVSSKFQAGSMHDLALILQLLLAQSHPHTFRQFVLGLPPEHIGIALLARQLLLQLATLALNLLNLHHKP